MGLPGDQPRHTTKPTDPSGALLLSGAYGALHPHKARCGGKKRLQEPRVPKKRHSCSLVGFYAGLQ